MSDLVEFLLARIAEDEVTAQRSTDLGDLEADGWYPDRLLAECEAKRRIIDEHTQRDDGGCYDCETPLCRFQQFLSVVYADHPDYRVEWRP